LGPRFGRIRAGDLLQIENTDRSSALLQIAAAGKGMSLVDK